MPAALGRIGFWLSLLALAGSTLPFVLPATWAPCNSILSYCRLLLAPASLLLCIIALLANKTKTCAKAGTLISGILVIVPLVSSSVFPFSIVAAKVAAEYRVRCADPRAILAACREMIAARETYGPRSKELEDGDVALDFRDNRTMDPKIPKIIRNLKPAMIWIDKDAVILQFVMGFAHYGLTGYAPGADPGGGDTEYSKKIIDGLRRTNE